MRTKKKRFNARVQRRARIKFHNTPWGGKISRALPPLFPTPVTGVDTNLLAKGVEDKVHMFEVAHQVTCGLSYDEIATRLHVGKQYIKDVLARVKEIDALEFDFASQDYIAKRFWLSCQYRLARLWSLHDKPVLGLETNPSEVKLKCLAAIHVIEKDMIKMAQDLGLIVNKGAEKPSDVTYFDLRTVDTQKLEALTSSMRMLTEQLGAIKVDGAVPAALSVRGGGEGNAVGPSGTDTANSFMDSPT